MAIWDNDGSNRAIQRMWDNDGSSHELWKMWDSDGTSRLVFQRLYSVYNQTKTTDYTGTFTVRTSGNNAYSNTAANGLYTYGYNTADSYAAYFTTSTIPITTYKTLTVTWNPTAKGSYATWGCNRIGLSTANTVAWSNGYPTGNLVSNYYVENIRTSGSTLTQTWTISSLTTNRYFATISCSGVDTSSSYWAKAYVYTIFLYDRR